MDSVSGHHQPSGLAGRATRSLGADRQGQPQVQLPGAEAHRSQRMFAEIRLRNPDGARTRQKLPKTWAIRLKRMAPCDFFWSAKCQILLIQSPFPRGQQNKKAQTSPMSTSCELEAETGHQWARLVASPCPWFLPCRPPRIVEDYRLPSLLMIYISTKAAHKKNICMSNPLDLISSEMLLHSRVKLHCLLEQLTISRMSLKSWTGLGRVENFRKLFPKFCVDVSFWRKDALLCTTPKHV